MIIFVGYINGWATPGGEGGVECVLYLYKEMLGLKYTLCEILLYYYGDPLRSRDNSV